MDSWSKEDYSRHVPEASMEVENLSEVNPSSDRVPGRGLLTLPISKALRGGTMEKFAILEVVEGFSLE